VAVSESRKAEVLAIVAEIAEVEASSLSPEASLADLGVDSLGGLRLVAAVEQRFGIVVEEAVIPRVRTVRDVLALVDEIDQSRSETPSS
jgi:acyl carrier protein